jgi:hypothetical protein
LAFLLLDTRPIRLLHATLGTEAQKRSSVGFVLSKRPLRVGLLLHSALLNLYPSGSDLSSSCNIRRRSCAPHTRGRPALRHDLSAGGYEAVAVGLRQPAALLASIRRRGLRFRDPALLLQIGASLDNHRGASSSLGLTRHHLHVRPSLIRTICAPDPRRERASRGSIIFSGRGSRSKPVLRAHP